MEYACFISSQALLSCGALERARSTFKLASSSKSFWQEAVSTVRGTGFGALGANAFRPLGRDLGMPKGSRGGIWANSAIGRTAQAARPPLLGLLWSGSSWATIYPCGGHGEDLPALIPERGLLIQHDVDMQQGAECRYGMPFQISGDGLRANFCIHSPVKTVAG